MKLSNVGFLFDFAQAARAGFDFGRSAVDDDAGRLKIGQPSAFRFDVRMGNFVADRRAFSANFTLSH